MLLEALERCTTRSCPMRNRCFRIIQDLKIKLPAEVEVETNEQTDGRAPRIITEPRPPRSRNNIQSRLFLSFCETMLTTQNSRTRVVVKEAEFAHKVLFPPFSRRRGASYHSVSFFRSLTISLFLSLHSFFIPLLFPASCWPPVSR